METTAKDNEIASLKAITTTNDESTKVQALQAETAALKVQLAQKTQTDGTQLVALSDDTPSTEALQQAKSSEAVMKEHATDESLSEETRESAKQALDELAAAHIKNAAHEGKTEAFGRHLVLVREERKLGEDMSEDMTKYLRGHRLLHYADAVIRVLGM
jgi:hypothetical protein